jgi:integrase
MKATKVLSHAAIVNAKPKDKPYKLADSHRLYVLVSVAGGKYWKWNYRLDGGDHTYTLGTFPDLGLSEARERRSALDKLVKKGVHPADHDEDQRLMVATDKATTFWTVADEWISANSVRWSAYYLQQVQNCMHRYIRDAPIGGRPIREVTTREIYALIDGVAKRTERTGNERKSNGAPTLAIMLRQWCSAVFRLAVASARADRNPVTDLKASDVIVRPKVKNNRALTVKELKKFLATLDRFTGRRTTAIAIEMLMLTFVRTTELRAATWAEFDLESGTWTIPADRMKVKDNGDHVVPLSFHALMLLQELREIVGDQEDGEQSLFPNQRQDGGHMTATTINRALERMGFNGKGTIGFSGHGFRGTASTMLHEQGFRPEVIEAQLAHKERNAVKAAYNKAQYIAERTEMMQSWAEYIDSLREYSPPFDSPTISKLS